MAKRKTVVGVSWRRLQPTPSPARGNCSTPSGRPGMLRSHVRNLATSNSVITNVMGRMTSFRGTLDTLRKVTLTSTEAGNRHRIIHIELSTSISSPDDFSTSVTRPDVLLRSISCSDDWTSYLCH